MVLEELAGVEPPVELRLGDEVVVDAVDLARPPRARRRRHRQLELGNVPEQPLDQSPLAGARLAGDDEDGQRATG